jgi:hypothetical protein
MAPVAPRCCGLDLHGSVEIQFHFALITFHRAAKNSIAALGTYIAGLFVSNPFFSTELSSVRDSPENNFLANGHCEVVNVLTGEFIALMAPRVPFFFRAFPYFTLATMHELFIR